MAYCIRVHEPGSPDVLKYEDLADIRPGPGEVLIRQTAIGVNYIDVYHRSGLYPVPVYPFIPGMEGAGIVEDCGAGVTDFKPGQRVAYASAPLGAYASSRLMPAHRLVALPDFISDEQAAAVMLKGLTAEYLLRRTYTVKPGDTIVIHAAAGGVGLIATQWAKSIGATVIGTVGSPEKASLARSFGVDYPVQYKTESLRDKVREVTGGKGVPVVYDSIGKDTFMESLDCLEPQGLMVSFGQASGKIPPFDPALLSQKGSLYLTRPSLIDYTADIEKLRQAATILFDVIRRGDVRVMIHQRFSLKDAAAAHRALEGRQTTGSTLLLPQD